MMVDTVTRKVFAPIDDHAAAVILDVVGRLPPLPPNVLRQDAGDYPCPPAYIDLEQIPAQLGEHTALGVRLTCFVNHLLGRVDPRPRDALDLEQHWHHAFEVATIAQELNAESGGRYDDRLLFASSVLHDVGKLVLNYCMPKAYARVRSHSHHHRKSLRLLEHSNFGIDHTSAGRRLAARWELPVELQDAIGRHHHPPALIDNFTGVPKFLATIQLANFLSHRERFGHPERAAPKTLQALFDRIDLDAGVAEAITARSAERADTIHDLLRRHLQCVTAPQTETWLRGWGLESSPLANRHAASDDTGRMLRAVTEFAASIAPSDREIDLCHHIVRCWTDLFDIDASVAFAMNPDHTLYYCSVRRGRRIVSSTVAVAAHQRPSDRGMDEYSATMLPRALIPAPPIADPVRERYRRILTADSQLMLPFIHDGKLLGGVLFDPQKLNRPDGRASAVRRTEWIEMLSAVFSAAIAQTIRRGRVEDINESLNAAHQCFYEHKEHLFASRLLAMTAEMAAGAAHELNSPLAVVSGRAQLLARNARDPADRRALETIREQSRICTDIVSQLISYAKPQPPQPAFLILGQWLPDILEAWRSRNPDSTVTLQIQVDDPDVRIWADPKQLEEVFSALITNAVESLPVENARLMINSRPSTSDDTVVIAVEDNGHGMSSEVLQHACDPFFSHHHAGRRRGLGLPIAQRLVDMNNGRLWLESAPGAGTTCFVELPCAMPRHDSS
ncbi:MAG: HDOD domain-containing protein [Phycisphaerae bacterium]